MIINKALIITGVYYLSVAAAGFLVFIIVLAIIKYIIYVLLFIFTAGKLKFWIFPNLTEDVGFFESFWPAYVYTYDKPKKAKDSDDEESGVRDNLNDSSPFLCTTCNKTFRVERLWRKHMVWPLS